MTGILARVINIRMKRAFTLVELLIVIAIIGILSSVVLMSLNQARNKAQDARRKSDLAQIVRSLNFYYDKYGNFMEAGSGCGSAGAGNGYFNYSNGGTYPISMGQCLVNEGITPAEIIDPSGKRSSGGYMKYTCSLGTYVFANLETLPTGSTLTDGTCCASCDSSYGMNYYVHIAP